MRFVLKLAVAAGLLTLAACQPQHGPGGHSPAGSADARNQVKIDRNGDQICISSNGLPDHATGTFPNPGNPHTMRAQRTSVCVDATPTKGPAPRDIRGSVGIALNGVIIRPGTADYYDAEARRGFSRDRASGWNLEGMGARVLLGLDENNAHVDNRGLYHYHGTPTGLLPNLQDSMLGWAADGFALHMAPAGVTSAWQLKPGTRPTAPGGAYDGTYVQDWQYVAGSGTLDQCNGGMLDGTFVYFVTDTYPFFPRCLWGNVSRDFGRP